MNEATLFDYIKKIINDSLEMKKGLLEKNVRDIEKVAGFNNFEKVIKKLQSMGVLKTKAKYFLIYIVVKGKPFPANSVSLLECLRLLKQLKRESKMLIKIDKLREIQTVNLEEACETVSHNFLKLADK